MIVWKMSIFERRRLGVLNTTGNIIMYIDAWNPRIICNFVV